MIINGEIEEIFNFVLSFEELQILEEMGTHTNPSPSKSTFVIVMLLPTMPKVHGMLLHEIA